MGNEKESPPTGSPNWLLGLDKLTTPSLDYVGLKLRDKLRAYLNEKARDRAMLRRYEKEFLYREIELLNYGTDQYAAYLETLAITRSSLECPACHGDLCSRELDSYCPECGAVGLKPGGWFQSPHCDSCGKSLRQGKGRNYKIRACTHCGLSLDDRGL